MAKRGRTKATPLHWVHWDAEATARLALPQLNAAVRCGDLQFAPTAAHRAGERLGAKLPLYGNRKVRANPAIGGAGIYFEFRGGRQRNIHTAVGGQQLQLAAPL